MIPRVAVFLFLVPFVLAVNPTVNLGYTQYQGVAIPAGITQWLGMRFAAPPLGDLRFRAPADPVANDTVQMADQVSRGSRRTRGHY